MELNEAMEFVRAGRQGVLTTIRRDGRPQPSNIVYTVDDAGTIRISVTAPRAKTKNLARDPRAVLYVCRENFWAYVVLDGTVELSPVVTDPHGAVADELVDVYRGVAGEHGDWDDYRAALVRDERLVVRFTPTSAYGMLPSA
jgi:PPOX class probable F420-dependent enzyme